MSAEKNDYVRMSGRGPGYVSLEGLTPGELDVCVASFGSGAKWVRVVDGRLESTDAFLDFPDPVADESMQPFWRLPTLAETEAAKTRQLTLLELGEHDNHSSPSIFISSLCGYNYSPENYQEQAQKLESYGFYIMRSLRGQNGRYWEQWYLPGLWSAKGDLLEEIRRSRTAGKTDLLHEAVEFLRTHVQFGALDVSVQRIAMVISD